GPGQPGFQGRPGGGEPSGPGGPGGAAPSPPPDVGSWLTINPALKSVLDKIEKTEKGQPVTVLTVAVDGKLGKPLYTVAQSLLTGANLSGNFVLKIPPLPKDAPKLPDIKSALDNPGAAIGFSLVDLNADKISTILGIEYGDDNKAYKDEQELNKAL